MGRTAFLFLLALTACVVVQGCDDPKDAGNPSAGAGAGGPPPAMMGPMQPVAMGPLAGAGGVMATGGSTPAMAAGSTAAGQGGGGSGGSAGSAGTPMDAGTRVDAGGGNAGTDAGGQNEPDAAGEDPNDIASELHELFIHDECTGEFAQQPDTCLHAQKHEEEITLGGEPGTVYDVKLRVRGLFEPTTINGGQVPMPQHPYFKVGGTVAAADYNQWHIEVSQPMAQTYWLNHYPSTSHTIYKEDFEATIPITGGSKVIVGVVDGNDREIDNAENGPPDRRQQIEGVTTEVLDGQILRLDVISVEPR